MSSRPSIAELRQEIERIVRQVLAEMEAKGRDATPAPAGELVYSGKVVSLKELERRLDGVSRLVVPRGAIITPAARDELKHRGISIASAVDRPS